VVFYDILFNFSNVFVLSKQYAFRIHGFSIKQGFFSLSTIGVLKPAGLFFVARAGEHQLDDIYTHMHTHTHTHTDTHTPPAGNIGFGGKTFFWLTTHIKEGQRKP